MLCYPERAKVEEALQEQETTGVGAMQQKLLGLQGEINDARDKLQASEARVAQNLKRVDELKAEAVSMTHIQDRSLQAIV